jgi:hypothetical protein
MRTLIEDITANSIKASYNRNLQGEVKGKYLDDNATNTALNCTKPQNEYDQNCIEETLVSIISRME